MRDKFKTTSFGRALGRVANGTLSAANRLALRLYLAREARKKLSSENSSADRKSDLKTGLLAHVYYPELLDEILACRACLPANAICHLTAPPEAGEVLRERTAALPDTILTIVENRGRDIAPFLSVLRSGVLDDLDVVLKIHSKRSPHLRYGPDLRRAMFTSLAGRPDVVERILAIMSNPKVGLVGWRRVFLTAARHWHTNRSRVEELASSLNPPAEPRLAFFGGSMFWFRPAALRSVAALPLSVEDFEPEAGQIDGTLHHALERCFAIAASAAGYSTCDTQGNVLLEARHVGEGAVSAGARGHRTP